MPDTHDISEPKRRNRRLGLNTVGLLAGVGLLGALLWRTDTTELATRLSGAWMFFVPAFAAYVLNLVASSASWRATFGGSTHTQPSLRTMVMAFWVGHAVNGLTPGATAGEVVKSRILAREVGGEEAAASVVIYNYWNLVSTLAFTLLAPLLALPFLALPASVMWGIFGLGSVFGLGLLAVGLLLRRGLGRPAVRILAKLPFVHIKNLEQLERKAADVDARVRRFRKDEPAAHRRVLGFALLARLALTAESALLAWGVLPHHDLAYLLPLALLIQSASKLLGWLTAFVPGRVGVAEGGVMMLFGLLSLPTAAGLTYGVLGRLRHLLGMGIGMLIASFAAPPKRPGSHSRTSLAPLLTSSRD